MLLIQGLTGPWTTTTASSWPAPAPGSPTWSSSTSCATSTTASTSRSSTPRTSTPPSPHAVGGTVVQLGAPGVRVNPFDLPPGDHRPGRPDPPGPVPPHPGRRPARRAAAPARARRPRHGDHRHLHRRRDHPRPGHLAPARAPARRPRRRPHPTDRGRRPGRRPTRRTGPARTPSHAASPSAAGTLLARLSPWIEGSFKDLFDGPTTDQPAGHLVVWSIRHLPDELRAAGMLLALDAIWRDVDLPTTPLARPARSRLPNPLANPLAGRSPNPLAGQSSNQHRHRPSEGHPRVRSASPGCGGWSSWTRRGP